MKCFATSSGALLALFSCSSQPDEIGAPKIYYGQDVCAECSMIVSEERFAGAVGLRAGGKIQYLMFDDIGEMFEFEPPPNDELQWFVHDATTLEWLDAREALYVRSDRLRTPMGTGLAAYGTSERVALALEEYGGERLNFAILRSP